jgi:hypothetical protein
MKANERRCDVCMCFTYECVNCSSSDGLVVMVSVKFVSSEEIYWLVCDLMCAMIFIADM